jgi:hypothetical protein
MEARVIRNRSQEGSPTDSHGSDAEHELHDVDDDDGDVVAEEEEEEKEELPPYLPSVYGCRSMDEFEVSFWTLNGYIFFQIIYHILSIIVHTFSLKTMLKYCLHTIL